MEMINVVFQCPEGAFVFPNQVCLQDQKLISFTQNLDKLVKEKKEYTHIAPNGEILFYVSPKNKNICTCGAEKKNKILLHTIVDKYFSKEEYEIYNAWYDECDENCPAKDDIITNDNKTSIIEKCTCGTTKKNLILYEKKQKLLKNEKEFEEEIANMDFEFHKPHCNCLKHNFIFKPNNEKEEFCLDWNQTQFYINNATPILSPEIVIQKLTNCLTQINDIVNNAIQN